LGKEEKTRVRNTVEGVGAWTEYKKQEQNGRSTGIKRSRRNVLEETGGKSCRWVRQRRSSTRK
jgi:hypothetical protein